MVTLLSVAPPLALTVLGLQFCLHRSALEQEDPDSIETCLSWSRDLPIRLQHQCSSAITQQSSQEQKSYRLLPNETVGVHCIMMSLKIILLLQDKYHDHFLLVMIALSLS